MWISFVFDESGIMLVSKEHDSKEDALEWFAFRGEFKEYPGECEGDIVMEYPDGVSVSVEKAIPNTLLTDDPLTRESYNL